MRMRAPFLSALLFAAAMSCALMPAGAETWPQRPVKIIIPLPAGLGTDLALRLFAEKLSARWGQPVVVDNRPGADGIVGVTSFVNAHDDHMLLFSFAGPITINPLMHDKLPYDPERDLVPIAMAIDNFFAIAVATAAGVSSLPSFARGGTRASGEVQLGRHPGPAAVHLPGAAEAGGAFADTVAIPRFRARGAGPCRKSHSGGGDGTHYFDARRQDRQGAAADGDQPATLSNRA